MGDKLVETGFKHPNSAVAYQLVSNRGIRPTLASNDNHFQLYSAYDYEVPAFGGRTYVVFDLKLRAPTGRYIRLVSRLGLAMYNGVVVHADNMKWSGNTGVLLFNFSDQPFYVYRGMHVVDAICEVFSKTDLVEIPMEAKINIGGPINATHGFHNFLMRTDFAEGRNPIPLGIKYPCSGYGDEYGPEWGSSVYYPKEQVCMHWRSGNSTFATEKTPNWYAVNPPKPLPPPVYQISETPLNKLMKIDDSHIRNLNKNVIADPPSPPEHIDTTVPPPQSSKAADCDERYVYKGATI